MAFAHCKPTWPLSRPQNSISRALRRDHSSEYRVVASHTLRTAQHLADFDILVIANSAPGENVAIVSESKINSDTDIQLTASPGTGSSSSAFTDDEISAVADWVKAGGSLFLLADHAPFSLGAAALASRFGVGMSNG